MVDYVAGLNTQLVRESLRLLIEEEMPSIMAKEYILLNVLGKRVATQATIKDNVSVGGSSAAIRAVTADRASDGTSEQAVPFTLPIGDYAITSTLQVLKTQAIQAANTAPGALADLFRYQLQGRIREILRSTNALVFSGDGTTDDGEFVGMETVVTATTYAGIATADHPRWACIDQELELTEDNLLTMERLIREAESNYTAIVTTPAIVETYKKLFAGLRTFQVANGSNPADLGINTVTYNGRPVIDDTQCPADTLFFVNLADVNLYSYYTGTSEDVMGLQIDINPIETKNPYLLEWEVGLIPQLAVKNRRSVARMTLPTPVEP